MKERILCFAMVCIILGLTACGNTEGKNGSRKDRLPKETCSVSTDVVLPSDETTEQPGEDQVVPSEENTVQGVYPPAQLLKDVDWEDLGSRITEQDRQTLQTYLPVVRDGEAFTWIYRSDEGEKPYAHAACQVSIHGMIEEQLKGNDEIPAQEPIVDSLLFADVFQSGSQDLILCLQNLGWEWLILHCEDGKIYGIDMPIRWFQGLQEDGLYFGSGGASSRYYYRMKFQDGDYMEELIAHVEKYPDYVEIDDEKKTKEEFAAWEKEYIKEEVKRYTPLRKE